MTKQSFTKPIIIKSLLLAFGLLGQCYSLIKGDGFMSSAHFLFFTNLSNIWIMGITAFTLFYDIKSVKEGRKVTPPKWVNIVRFIFTVSITLTFLVFSLMLTPSFIADGRTEFIFSVENLCVHNLVPVLAIIDWCLYAYDCPTGKNTYLLGTIMPIIYVVFTLIFSTTGFDYGHGSNVPYFFLDYEKNGWFSLGNGKFGVCWWIIILSLAVVGMGKVFVTIKNKRFKKISALYSEKESIKI